MPSGVNNGRYYIEFVKKENEKQVIKALKDHFKILRVEHKIIPDIEFENCLRLLSAYYFEKKEK